MSNTKPNLIIKILQGLLVVLLVCLIYWTWCLIQNPRTLPFKKIMIISTAAHVKADALKVLVRRHINGGFFAIDIAKLKTALQSEPWIKRVSVRRMWPSTLEITIIEQQAVLRWNQNQLINAQGQVFVPPVASFPKNLPEIYSPQNALPLALKNYAIFVKLLASQHLKICALTLTLRHAWHAQLCNGMQIILGRQSVVPRLQRFMQLYPKIIGKREAWVRLVDLRYPNGAAIQWRRP